MYLDNEVRINWIDDCKIIMSRGSIFVTQSVNPI